MKQIFLQDSPYKKRARFLAMLWTLLILTGCLMPASEVPHVQVPLIDKWVHLVFFGGFTFLWLCSQPTTRLAKLCLMLALAAAFGTIIELLQGALPVLGRSSEVLDVLADSIGGILGIVLFSIGAKFSKA